MKENQIFIHIPKTGGTTLDCAINGTEWIQGKNEFNYRHIVHKTKLSNAGDIFKSQNFDKYKNYKIYMMLRHPVDKVVSEYFFVRDRKEYFALFKKKPKNLTEYAKNPQACNSTLNFLLGKRFYPNSPATKSDLERVIKMADSLPIHVGIFEEYSKSLDFFRDKLDIKIPAKIDVKRVTLNRPKIEELDDEIRALILEKNKLDLELYEYYFEKLNQENIKSKKYTISKDRYGYIMKYTQRFSLFQLFIPKSEFLLKNAEYLNNMNFFLHQKVNFKEGKKYATIFNRMIIRDLEDRLPGSATELDGFANSMNEDPLQTTEALSQFIAKNWLAKKSKLKTPFKFDVSNYPEEIFQFAVAKKSFLSRLFGK